MMLKSSAEGEGWRPVPKKLKIFGSLVSEIVNKNLCMYCGACIASCPIDILFHSDAEDPVMKGPCAACQVCYYSCPRVELPLAEVEQRVFGRTRRPDEEVLGVHIGEYAVRARDPEILQTCQDGGAATAFLVYALEQKIVDYALVSGYSAYDPMKPEPTVAATKKEVIAAAGSRYTPGGQIGALSEIAIPNRAVPNYKENRLALVGLPCELQGFWRMSTHWLAAPKLGRNVVFTIGLFCSLIFDYEKLMKGYVRDQVGVDLSKISRVDVVKGRFIVKENGNVRIDVPVGDVHQYGRPECQPCIDYSAELADIGVGNIGSPQGWTTVLTRTPVAEEIVKGAAEAGIIELKPLSEMKPGINLLVKHCEKKRKRNSSAYLRTETSVPKLPVPFELPVVSG